MQKILLFISFLCLSACSKDAVSNTSNQLYEGSYEGIFSGQDRGTLSFKIETDGALVGEVYSHVLHKHTKLLGKCLADGSFTMKMEGTKREYIGSILNGAFRGKWMNKSTDFIGEFSGKKVVQ